ELGLPRPRAGGCWAPDIRSRDPARHARSRPRSAASYSNPAARRNGAHASFGYGIARASRALEAARPDIAVSADRAVADRHFHRRCELYRGRPPFRSEEHTSELQSRENLVCRLLLEKKKK